jgi:hypothetical protein
VRPRQCFAAPAFLLHGDALVRKRSPVRAQPSTSFVCSQHPAQCMPVNEAGGGGAKRGGSFLAGVRRAFSSFTSGSRKVCLGLRFRYQHSSRLLRFSSNPQADMLLCLQDRMAMSAGLGRGDCALLQGDRVPLSPVKTMATKGTSPQKASAAPTCAFAAGCRLLGTNCRVLSAYNCRAAGQDPANKGQLLVRCAGQGLSGDASRRSSAGGEPGARRRHCDRAG